VKYFLLIFPYFLSLWRSPDFLMMMPGLEIHILRIHTRIEMTFDDEVWGG
jgi:hypothetical protein